MTITKFADHPAAACRVVVFDDGLIALQSYSTYVIDIDRDGWMTVHGLYSRTTIKHIGWFMRSIGSNYYFAKNLYENRLQYNVNTGEYRARV